MNDLTCVFHLGKQCLTNIQKRELIIKFGSFFCDFFCRARAQCIHDDMSYLYAGR